MLPTDEDEGHSGPSGGKERKVASKAQTECYLALPYLTVLVVFIECCQSSYLTLPLMVDLVVQASKKYLTYLMMPTNDGLPDWLSVHKKVLW